MLIPISGKPGDLNVEDIKSASDAHRVLLWLTSVLKDMATQVTERGASPDPEWLRKLRAAQRATNNLLHRVLERRDSYADEMSAQEAIANAMAEVLSKDERERIAVWIEENTPHLSGLDFKALAKDQPT